MNDRTAANSKLNYNASRDVTTLTRLKKQINKGFPTGVRKCVHLCVCMCVYMVASMSAHVHVHTNVMGRGRILRRSRSVLGLPKYSHKCTHTHTSHCCHRLQKPSALETQQGKRVEMERGWRVVSSVSACCIVAAKMLFYSIKLGRIEHFSLTQSARQLPQLSGVNSSEQTSLHFAG